MVIRIRCDALEKEKFCLGSSVGRNSGGSGSSRQRASKIFAKGFPLNLGKVKVVGSIPTRGFMAVHDTTAGVVEKDGKILLIKRGNPQYYGFWAVPGGHVDPGENVKVAADREMKEEVGGVELEDKPFFVFVHTWPPDSKIREEHEHRCYTFRGRVSGKIQAGSDASAFKWCTREEVKKMKLVGYTTTILKKIGWLLD